MDAISGLRSLSLSSSSAFKKRHWKKLALVGLICCLNGSFLMIWYWQTIRAWKMEKTQLLDDTKKTLTQALSAYQQFAHLLEFRLLHAVSQGDLEKIPKILTQKIELMSGTHFPEIISTRFVPAAQPQVLYSRLGKRTSRESSSLVDQEGTVWRREREFETHKILRDNSQRKIGSLSVAFSVNHVLQKAAVVEALEILPRPQAGLQSKAFLEIPGLPYVLASKSAPPSITPIMDYLG